MGRDRPLWAAICRSLERKSLVFLGLVLSSQAEGRGFDSGLVLQKSPAPSRCCGGGGHSTSNCLFSEGERPS